MTDPADFNPYAPSGLTESVSFARIEDDSDQAQRLEGTPRVVLLTLVSVICSGALFGLSLGLFISILGGLQGAGVNSLIGIAALAVGGVIYGAIIAAVFGLPTVVVIMCLSAPVVPLSRGWRPRQMHVFAALCGLISGFMPIAIFSEFELAGLATSLVPAGFGAVGTWILVRLLSRSPRPPKVPTVSNLDTLADSTQRNVT